MTHFKPHFKVGDEVLYRGAQGVRLGRIVDVLPVAVGKRAAYQVRVGMLTHVEDEENLRPARPDVRRTA